MLETLREYAAEQLTLKERGHLEHRHAEHFLALAEAAQPQLSGPEQARWLARLETEQDNFRAALCWSLANEPALALHLAAALGGFWEAHSHFAEGCDWLERALASNGDTTQTGSHAAPQYTWALCAAGRLRWQGGDFTTAQRHLNESLRLFRASGDTRGTIHALSSLGWSAVGREPEAAREWLLEAMATAQAAGELWGTGHVLWGLIAVAASHTDLEKVRDLAFERLDLFRAAQDDRNTAYATSSLGHAAYFLHDFATARAAYDESIRLFEALGDKYSVSGAIWGQGDIARQEGDLPRARQLLEQFCRLSLAVGSRWSMPIVLHYLSYLIGAEGRPELAAQLMGAARQVGEAVGFETPPIMQPDYERHQSALRATLGEAAYDRCWSQGRALTLEQAVEMALQE